MGGGGTGGGDTTQKGPFRAWKGGAPQPKDGKWPSVLQQPGTLFPLFSAKRSTLPLGILIPSFQPACFKRSNSTPGPLTPCD